MLQYYHGKHCGASYSPHKRKHNNKKQSCRLWRSMLRFTTRKQVIEGSRGGRTRRRLSAHDARYRCSSNLAAPLRVSCLPFFHTFKKVQNLPSLKQLLQLRRAEEKCRVAWTHTYRWVLPRKRLIYYQPSRFDGVTQVWDEGAMEVIEDENSAVCFCL